MSLRAKLTVTVIAIFVLAMGALTIISQASGRRVISDGARREMANLAQAKAAAVSAELERRRAQAISLASHARGYAGGDRTVIRDAIREELRDGEGLFGAWIVYLPGMAPGRDADYAGTHLGDKKGVYSPFWTLEDGQLVDGVGTDDVAVEYGEDYFAVPNKSGLPTVTEPYVDKSVGRLMTSVAVPLRRGDTRLGVAGVDISLNDLAQGVSAVKVFDSGYAMLVSERGVMMAAPNKKLVGAAKFPGLKGMDPGAARRILAATRAGKTSEISTRDPFSGRSAHMFSVPIGRAGWTYTVVVPDEEMLAPIGDLRRALIITGAISIPIVALLLLVVIGRMMAPLGALRRAAGRISKGDLDVEVAVRSQDEIGALAGTFNDMTAYLRETADVAERVAAGDLTASPRVRSDRDALGHSLTNMISSLRALVRQVADASTAVRSSGQRMAEEAHSARLATAEMAATVQRVAVGAVEQSAVIGDSTRAVEDAHNAVASAGSAARQGLARSDDTRGTMRDIAAASEAVKAAISELEETSRQVVGITEEVDGIAGQTQLLALNASIEAARAGEHGAGFAVVADEVASLASRAQVASAGIRTLVEQTRAQVARAVEIVDEGQRRTQAGAEVLERARDAFGEIQDGVDSVRARIAEIQDASETVTRVASAATSTTTEAEAVAQRVTDATQAIDDSAAQLADEARRLSQSVDRFQL